MCSVEALTGPRGPYAGRPGRPTAAARAVQALMQEGILVSPRMMADHMPEYLTAVLRRMSRERGRTCTHSGCVELDMEACDQGDPERLDH